MKNLLVLSLFILSLNAMADSMESHIADTVKPLGKLLEGKKGKVVLGTFKSSKLTDTCTPNKGVNSKVSAALSRAGVKTTIATRAVGIDADQAEISRVAKLSGGSYIILGTYEITGTKFKLECTLYDHNGAGVGACDEIASATITEEAANSINCPKALDEKPIVEVKASDVEASDADDSVKKVDDYICSVIHRDYDLKRLVTALYEKKYYTLEDLKGITKESTQDALEVKKDYCVTLGNFVLCSDYWQGTGAQVFLGDGSALGASKVLSWKHPKKSQVKDASRCLKKDDNWWNP